MKLHFFNNRGWIPSKPGPLDELSELSLEYISLIEKVSECIFTPQSEVRPWFEADRIPDGGTYTEPKKTAKNSETIGFVVAEVCSRCTLQGILCPPRLVLTNF